MTEQKRSAGEMMERCHVRLNERAAELCSAADALAEGSDVEAATATVKQVVAFLKRTGRRHINDEEQSIFPHLPDDTKELTEQLSLEHREQEKMLRNIDKLMALWPVRPPSAKEVTQLQQLAKQLADSYQQHAALEDERLAPALAALSDEQRQDIVEEMQARRDVRGSGKRGRGGGGGRGGGEGRRGGRGGGGGGGGGGRGGGWGGGGSRTGGGGDR